MTIILDSLEDGELARIGREGNHQYLIQDDEQAFPHLEQLCLCSYDVFGSGKAGAIIEELQRVRLTVAEPEDRAHIDAIIRLAERCRANPRYVLVLTPFE